MSENERIGRAECIEGRIFDMVWEEGMDKEFEVVSERVVRGGVSEESSNDGTGKDMLDNQVKYIEEGEVRVDSLSAYS
ncbi:hypothetical protein PilKf_02630 [Pillotina sp. SPG140]